MSDEETDDDDHKRILHTQSGNNIGIIKRVCVRVCARVRVFGVSRDKSAHTRGDKDEAGLVCVEMAR